MSWFSRFFAKSPSRPVVVRRSRLGLETLEDRLTPAANPVLMVLPNQDFWYQDYADTRAALTSAGVGVEVAATKLALARPHAGSGQGADGGLVMPDVTLAQADPQRYSAIVFVGGWGAASYQYAFPGSYINTAYRGDAATKDDVNTLIGDFLAQDKYVAGICFGVTALAWARVDGHSPLEGKTIAGYWGAAPNSTVGAASQTHWQLAANGANHVASGSVGNPRSWSDDVLVSGKIITAEDWRSATRFGQVIAEQVNTLPPPPPPPAPAPVAPTMSIVATTSSVAENGTTPMTFIVSRDVAAPLDQALSVTYLVSGTVSAGDFAPLSMTVVVAAGQQSATISVTPIDDNAVEGDETVSIALQPGAGYQLGTQISATGTITDNDRAPATVSITATQPSVAENSGTLLQFTVSRAASDPIDQPMTINFSVGGTASASDYASMSGSVVIAAGQSSATIAVAPVNDSTAEGAETVILTLQPGTGYRVGAASAAVATITDDDRLPVLMIIANRDFYYQEYNDSRRGLEQQGLSVQVAATTMTVCMPHANSGQGTGSGNVMPNLTIAQASAANYSAVVFVGGWGASSYQYAFEGTYANIAYNGSTVSRSQVNQLINDFVAQDKYVAAVCHGVSVLAYARVNGQSLLQGHTVSSYNGTSPPRTDGGTGIDTSRWHIERNGATMVGSGSVGNLWTATDDVIVDGKIITAENWDSAMLFGQTVGQQVLR